MSEAVALLSAWPMAVIPFGPFTLTPLEPLGLWLNRFSSAHERNVSRERRLLNGPGYCTR